MSQPSDLGGGGVGEIMIAGAVSPMALTRITVAIIAPRSTGGSFLIKKKQVSIDCSSSALWSTHAKCCYVLNPISRPIFEPH